mmetsp:Transcript_97031/g.270003  ORF Transcript_97031/g.270003 Transcript_97031/m.270003 type:complete len:147 (-) Transcript_97031:60-500(-)
MAMLTAVAAQQLQEDLMTAFGANDFQLKLLAFRQAHHISEDARRAAMRETAMAAQREVLIKYNFSPNYQGVAQMVRALASYFVDHEGLSHMDAVAKAKAVAVGMTPGHEQRWNWPRPSGPVGDADSTALPGTDCDLASLPEHGDGD